MLTTDEGNPLVKYWLEDGKMRRYDAIQSAWTRLAEKMGGKIRLGMKHLRKTSAIAPGAASAVQVLRESLPCRLTQEHC